MWVLASPEKGNTSCQASLGVGLEVPECPFPCILSAWVMKMSLDSQGEEIDPISWCEEGHVHAGRGGFQDGRLWKWPKPPVTLYSSFDLPWHDLITWDNTWKVSKPLVWHIASVQQALLITIVIVVMMLMSCWAWQWLCRLLLLEPLKFWTESS